MNLEARITRIEDRLPKRADGCATCKHWIPAGNQLAGDDGELWPRVCPDCHREIPVIHLTVLQGINIREDL